MLGPEPKATRKQSISRTPADQEMPMQALAG